MDINEMVDEVGAKLKRAAVRTSRGISGRCDNKDGRS
jgi:hypothetical protein